MTESRWGVVLMKYNLGDKQCHEADLSFKIKKGRYKFSEQPRLLLGFCFSICAYGSHWQPATLQA
jgi:hypothetical protein